MKKERKVSNCKSRRLEPKIIKLLDGTKSYSEIGRIVGLSPATVGEVARRNNIRIRRMGYPEKTERNEEIRSLLDEGFTYTEIGEKFGVTKARINQIAKRYGIKRWEQNRKFYEEMIQKITNDIEANVSYGDIKNKYDITPKRASRLRHYGLPAIYTELIEKRNQKVLEEYRVKRAKDIVNSNNHTLNNPEPINDLNTVYRIATKKGYRKYPKIGNRSGGGLFESQEVIKIIKNKKEQGLSFNEIANYLNDKGYTTITGKPYKGGNVRSKYLKIKELSL